MTKEQEVVRSVFDAYIRDIKAVSDKDRPTIDMLEEVKSKTIKALELVEEFETAQIITGGRLNGRTYAYKRGLEDGRRKVLEEINEEQVRVIDSSEIDIQKFTEAMKRQPLQVISCSHRDPEDKKQIMIYELSKESEMVIATAYLYAKTYTTYGEDITKAWTTAVRQKAILEKAYNNGYSDALKERFIKQW